MSTLRIASRHGRGNVLGSFHRSFSRQVRSSKTDESKKKPKKNALSIAERCKGILALNWRGQLTTVKPKLVDKEEQMRTGRTLGELSYYTMLDEKPVVWIPESSQHCPNLLLNNRASLISGHTDPSPLMKVFQQIKKEPPHATLVGTLIIPDDEDDMVSSDFMKVIIKKRLSELQSAVNDSSPTIRAILESGGHVLRAHVQALNSMLNSQQDDTFYRFDISSCNYIDMSGQKHVVDLEALHDAKGPISPLLPIIIEGINRNQGRRMGLKLLCAYFLRVKVEDVFVFSADRKGVNLLVQVLAENKVSETISKRSKSSGKKSDDSPAYEWKDLRLNFKQEAGDVNGLCSMLAQMEKESFLALNQTRTEKNNENEEEDMELNET